MLNKPKKVSILPTKSSCVLFIIFTFCSANAASTISANTDKEYVNYTYLKKTTVAKEICETPGCIRAAASILDNMDKTVDPCDNFYNFACGNFVKNTIIPDDKGRIDSFIKIDDTLQYQLKTSIEDFIKENDTRSFKLLQTFYKTCMDIDNIEKTSNNDFLEILKKLGGWPLLEGKSWNESSFDWKASVYHCREIGYSTNFFIYFSIDIDDKNNSRRLVSLDQASLGLSREYLLKGLDEKVVKAYVKYMVDVAEILGADRDQAEKEFADVLNFEIALAKISLPREERRNYSQLYNLMTIEELESKYPAIPWLEYLNGILKPYAQLSSKESIIVSVPSYLESFSKLINETPKRTQANYVMWRVAKNSAGLLNEKVQLAQSVAINLIRGSTEREARWKDCVYYAAGNLPYATSALYVRNYFDRNSKATAEDIVENIRRGFRTMLKDVDWMDEKTRSAALEKLKYIRPYIAYPDELLDDRKIDEYYKNLEIHPESFLKSQLKLNLFRLEIAYRRLRDPVNRTDWTSYGRADTVNAYYRPLDNSIQFPAGILQGVFFSNDKPKYFNYGAIGFVMGHEMTHGFDDKGSQYDKDGNLIDWWEPETKQKYLERAKCIIEQYNNFTVKEVGLNIHGKNTQGENIADIGGVKEAYIAYNRWEQRNKQEPRLPGLNYTSQQMFWLSTANIWCAKFRPEMLRSRVITGVHSPNEFRVNGPLSNIPEFAEDFNCPIGSNMNPVKKCTVW